MEDFARIFLEFFIEIFKDNTKVILFLSSLIIIIFLINAFLKIDAPAGADM